MRLLTGPPGSGKTFHALSDLRQAVDRRDAGVRLLVPTSTMAEYLRHKLAREGRVVRPSHILTLSQFIARWTEDLPQVSEAALQWIVEKAVERLRLPEFQRVAGFTGFPAALAGTIEELSTAGCSARRLAECLPEGPLAGAFHAVYQSVENDLRKRGQALRGVRLELAARRIDREGLGNIHTVWMDGFFSLSDPEIAVAAAIGRRAQTTITLPEMAGPNPSRDALLALGFKEQRTEWRRQEPARELFRAPTPDREAIEIARRIIEESAAGRPFRDIGIVVRNPEVYAPVLEGALERFGIPARFYFASQLAGQAVARLLAGAVDALLGGWDHAATLALLRHTGAAGPSPEADRFDFDLRRRLPGRGLDPLRELARGDAPILSMLDRLAALDAWQSILLTPDQWAVRMKGLRALVTPERPPDGPLTPRASALWRGQTSALDAFDAAMDEGAECLDSGVRVTLDVFWQSASAMLRLTPLRVADGRHNVVHVISVYEARQWELPVVFVCGMVEKQFPRHVSQEAFFPDRGRRELARAGIRLRTTAEREEEEQFLFHVASTRATARLILSYPEADAQGAATLPSSFLDTDATANSARTVRPRPAFPTAITPPSPAIRDTELLAGLTHQYAGFSPSALDCFLDCPFQFFARHTLRLEGRPPRPQDRLDFLLRGTIVHNALAELFRHPGADLEPLFDAVFAFECDKKNVPRGYRSEYLRRQMLDDIRYFLDDVRVPFAAGTQSEVKFELPLAEGVVVRGRIDRIDSLPDGAALIIDYKYSAGQNVVDLARRTDRLQGPLYALAVERVLGMRVAGVFYCGLRKTVRKKEVQFAGWKDALANLPFSGEPLTRDWLAAGERSALISVAAIRAGRIAPMPADLDLCRRCDYRDVCRFKTAAGAAGAGAAAV